MTRSTFIKRLALLIVAGVALGFALKFLVSPRWFDLYGVATVMLVTLPFAAALLCKRLKARGGNRAWALIYIVPALVLSAGQIGYWTAFFSSPDTAIQLGLGRSLIRGQGGPVLPWLGGLLLLAWGYVVLRAASEPKSTKA